MVVVVVDLRWIRGQWFLLAPKELLANWVGGTFWECLFAMDNGRCARSERQGGERGEPWGGVL